METKRSKKKLNFLSKERNKTELIEIKETNGICETKGDIASIALQNLNVKSQIKGIPMIKNNTLEQEELKSNRFKLKRHWSFRNTYILKAWPVFLYVYLYEYLYVCLDFEDLWLVDTVKSGYIDQSDSSMVWRHTEARLAPGSPVQVYSDCWTAYGLSIVCAPPVPTKTL